MNWNRPLKLKSSKMDRRKFLGLSSAALIGLSLKSERPIAGSFVNESFQAGHLLRDHAGFPAPKRIEKVPLVIVGGGIAGLSAGWRLRKRGFTDFVLLEMNDAAGGNARWGENEITAYPWAAHYVPVPGPKAIYVRELFEDLGVLQNGKWNERYLCFSPQERLFLYGRWQEGIEPAVGLKPRDREQFQRLEEHFTKYRNSGEFTIPLELGRSNRSADLDRITFTDWLSQQGFDSPMIASSSSEFLTRASPVAKRGSSIRSSAFTISLPAKPKKKARSPGPKATAGLPAAYSNV